METMDLRKKKASMPRVYRPIMVPRVVASISEYIQKGQASIDEIQPYHSHHYLTYLHYKAPPYSCNQDFRGKGAISVTHTSIQAEEENISNE